MEKSLRILKILQQQSQYGNEHWPKLYHCSLWDKKIDLTTCPKFWATVTSCEKAARLSHTRFRGQKHIRTSQFFVTDHTLLVDYGSSLASFLQLAEVGVGYMREIMPYVTYPEASRDDWDIWVQLLYDFADEDPWPFQQNEMLTKIIGECSDRNGPISFERLRQSVWRASELLVIGLINEADAKRGRKVPSNDDVQRIRDYLNLHPGSKNDCPNAIIEKIKIKRKRGLDALRALNLSGEYKGFKRERLLRYRQSPKFDF